MLPPELHDNARELLAGQGLIPVFLDEAEQRAFYGRICNDTLWPLFHYFVDRLSFSEEAWQTYVAINERFAETIARSSPPRARVWVHDFHLALVPAMLRRLRPDLAIGFFLHVPFPSSEIYRLLPTRSEILRGILGADYVGFHTADYARHFRSSCLRMLALESAPGAVEDDGRTVGIGVHPIGIDVAGFRETLADEETATVADELERRYAGKRLVLGVERLDYTKGIPEKLEAFERMLEREPERADDTVMLQVLVPSRLESAEYRAKRDEIEVRIAHVNGRLGGLGRTPIEYVHRSISRSELAALYRRADVMMVTPLRDGMNLVAQEFVLCQTDELGTRRRRHGVLLLSEFAGAAQVLPGALLVNPWDAAALADRLVEALALEEQERRRRLELMAERVLRYDSRRWAASFLGRLEHFAALPSAGSGKPLEAGERARLARRFAATKPRTLVLDYDGTLRELAIHPGLAAPTEAILELLTALAQLPETQVHLLSGRTHTSLEEWFGALPIRLAAEHGYLVRDPDGSWRASADPDLSWRPGIERLFRRLSSDVPGSIVEGKQASVAWHYRLADPEYGSWRARELLLVLEEVLAGVAAEVLPGHQVVEVRARGVDKGAYLRRLLASEQATGLLLAAGDDRTDVDLYRALPAGSIALHVGALRPAAHNALVADQFTVRSPGALRGILRDLVDAARQRRDDVASTRSSGQGPTGGGDLRPLLAQQQRIARTLTEHLPGPERDRGLRPARPGTESG